MRRLSFAIVALALLSVGFAPSTQEGVPVNAPQPFAEWLDALRDEARERGYGDKLIAEALSDIEPLPRVIQADRSQAELNPGFERYLSTRLTAPVIRRGRE